MLSNELNKEQNLEEVSNSNKATNDKSLNFILNLKSSINNFFFRLFYIFQLVWQTRPWILILMVFVSLFNGISPIISAYISATLLNNLVVSYNAGINGLESEFSIVLGLLMLQFSFMFLSDLISNMNMILTQISNELVGNHVKLKIMNKAKEIDLVCFESSKFYEMYENACREASSKPVQVANSTFSIMSTLLSLFSFTLVLWGISPYASLLIIVLSIPSGIINFVYRRKNFHYLHERSKERRQINYYSDLMTNKDMVKEIRIFGLSDFFIQRYQIIYQQYFEGLKNLFTVEGFWSFIINMLSLIVNCILFIYIAHQVSIGFFEVGAFALYTGALKSITGGMSSLIIRTSSIYEGTLFIDNLIEFMKEKRTVVSSLVEPRSVQYNVSHRIVFDHVSFRYPGKEYYAIQDISITFDANDIVLLVGLNGAGKSTLVKLLTRLYDPTEGVIFLDGYDLREYKIDELYRVFGIGFQDFSKYPVSIMENIAFSAIEKPVDESAIQEAALKSNADEFINRLPKRYETPLMCIFEEDGVELSVGQWHKLALARAFYRDSDILILDEPTASLDALAEQNVFNEFNRMRNGKMTIFVSHQLSSSKIANKIVVLENGRIIEMGNHENLMEKKGRYFELFTIQAKNYTYS